MTNEILESCWLKRSGLEVGYVSRGRGPLVIFLHGFPDTWRGFLPILDQVAASGYRAVAPAARGYTGSGFAPDGDYRIEATASDVLGLADFLDAEKFSIVGHDWGAVNAYATANLAPERVQRLITAAVPHTGHFLLNIRLRQLIRSLYMVRFQIPVLPEWEIPRNDFAWIENLMRAWSPGWTFVEDQVLPVKNHLRDPARLKASLSYYRQLIRSLMSPLSRRLIFSPVATPTRMLFGTGDGCIGAELFQGQESRFTNGLELVSMQGAGHFMQWERPAEFARLVNDFLRPI